MVADCAHLQESHLATPDVVTPLRHAVARYARAAGIQGDQLDAVRLAVSEAVTNVVLHAYPDDESGHVYVTARLVGDELWVLIADDGCGLGAPALRPGLGWGLALITDACDEFTVAERAEGGTEARMVFRLVAQAEAADARDVADRGSAEPLSGDGAVSGADL